MAEETEKATQESVYTRFMSDGHYHWSICGVSHGENCVTYTYKFVEVTVLRVLKVALCARLLLKT